MNFEKKFNIGLTLETSLTDFSCFLKKYSPYIHSIYFSPPLGRFYHTRSKIALEFCIPGKKSAFWKMLYMIKEHGIELELLFNTLMLNGELINRAADELYKRKIEVDSVCFLKDYFDDVVKAFPSQKRILSFNNGFRTRAQIDAAIEKHQIDTFVLASSFIRSNKLFEHLSNKGKETYLILNNACSFNCNTCNNTQSVCEKSFIDNLKNHSIEYLYALQSIFPYELHEGIIDSGNITCFKISNRSSNLKFIADAMDSYISGEVRQYVEKDPMNYAIWGRAGYFWKHFKKMELDNVLKYKEEILSHVQKEGTEQ